MKLRIVSVLLVLGAACACASDVWIKPGAGADALARDKASCNERGATLDPSTRGAAFERCMEELDWWHMERTERAAPAARSTDDAPGPWLTDDGITKSGATAAPSAADLSDASAPAAADSTDPPTSVASAIDVTAAPPALPRTADPTPARVDPSLRQFWFKLGAGTPQLASDQAACRAELGIDPELESPSRWGERDDFDRCMRGRGWSGGSIEAR